MSALKRLSLLKVAFWIPLRFSCLIAFLASLSACLIGGINSVYAQNSSIAFFYGAPMPVELLSQFQQVVVEPENIGSEDLVTLRKYGAEVFAYLSIGEVERSRPWYDDIDRSWFLGVNQAWESDIIDLRRHGWHNYLLDNLIGDLWKRGYRAFFLDTLDSYQAVATGEAEQEAQVDALAELVQAMHKRFPGIKLLFNRGFEVLPKVWQLVSGVAAESLFYSWDTETQHYAPVAEEERKWLLPRLIEVKDRYRLPVIVIDYLPTDKRDLARQAAQQIASLGFTPWITNPSLDYIGVGAIEVFPRRILMLYDSQEATEGLAYSNAHRLISMPLEHMGYAIDYLDVRDVLPDYIVAGRYAGVVTWFTDDELYASDRYRNWLLRQLDAGIKVAVLGRLGFEPDPVFLKRLGIKVVDSKIKRPVSITFMDSFVGFESQPMPRTQNLYPWQIHSKESDTHLRLTDANDQRIDTVFTGPWGGMALDPYLIDTGFKDRMRWIIDPFEFLKRSLKLPVMPAADVTTENGSRLLITHIDGDGAANIGEMPGRPFAMEVIRDKFLKAYPLPTTVSIIEGEIGASGLYPELSPRLESVARDIFSLPDVEIASHSYSHPFDWSKAGKSGTEGDDYHLQIPGYTFNLERDISGSVNYINNRLSPPGKSVRVFLWTGNALPEKDALNLVQSMGLANMNGGNTRITYEEPSLTLVSPMGIPVDGYFQVYAPIMNENVYTNLWTGPFYGFRKVIETFELTDMPRRLKPINIYYHFYSGSKQASINALREVYDWSMAQETLPVLVSEYVYKVDSFQKLVLARRLDGGWLIDGLGAIKTMRLDHDLGWPDLNLSKGVIGLRNLPQGLYVSFSGDGPALLYLTEEPPTGPYLERANAFVKQWRKDGSTIHLRLKGHLPVRLTVAGTDGPCRISWSGGELNSNLMNNTQEFFFPVKDTGDARLFCE